MILWSPRWGLGIRLTALSCKGYMPQRPSDTDRHDDDDDDDEDPSNAKVPSFLSYLTRLSFGFPH